MTKQWALSGNAENVNWSDIAESGRAYADNLIGEPTISKVMHLMADEIEMLRQQWREMSSAMMQLRRENLHMKQELADVKRWAMSERAEKWDAVARLGASDPTGSE